MDANTTFFYVFAIMTVFAAVRVVTVRNPVHAALFLVLTFFSAAGIWLMLNAEFLAIVLVLVYIGAVMVLFLFVVMMLDINMQGERQGFWKAVPVALFVGGAIVVELALVLWIQFGQVRIADAPAVPVDFDNTRALGHLMFTEYVYPLQIAGVLLLVAMVAAIALTLRRRKDSKAQVPGEQVRVKSSDRLRIVQVPTSARQYVVPPAGRGAPAAAAAAVSPGGSPAAPGATPQPPAGAPGVAGGKA